MVNTIWKENFLIMCSKLCLNARDSGHFAQLLLICRNYSLQTIQALSCQGYTASMVPPTTACSASRVCSMSASRGVLSGFNDQHFHRHPPHQKFLSAHFFCLTVSSTIPVADARDTTTIASSGKPSPVCGRVCTLCGVSVGAGVGTGGCSGASAAVWERRGWWGVPRGAWLRLSSELTACRRVSIRHPHFRGRTGKISVINGFQLELHRVCNFKASRGGIFGQGVDVLSWLRPTV